VKDGTRFLFFDAEEFTDLEPLAQHVSGQLQTMVPDMKSDDWYKNTSLAKMHTMQKGPSMLAWV
jgi:hypothetical protein